MVITGNKEGDVEMMAYQVNQTLKLINTKKDRYYIESHRFYTKNDKSHFIDVLAGFKPVHGLGQR